MSEDPPRSPSAAVKAVEKFIKIRGLDIDELV